MNENIHSPANFNPGEYSVVDYLDNQRPRYCPGEDITEFRARIERWEAEIAHYFPNWKRAGQGHPDHDIHHCRHCGNGTVRYIAVVQHDPTKTLVVFGSECVEKLQFRNRDELKVAQLKAKAALGAARLKVYRIREEFLAQPDNAPLLDAITNRVWERPEHAKNEFVRDLVAKLNTYGTLSPSQVAWFFKSLKQDLDRAERAKQEEIRKATAQPAPEGRLTIKGEIVSTRTQDSRFGIVHKMLVLLETGAKVWGTIPSSADTDIKGKRCSFTATFERSKDDPTFGFFSRPTKFSLLTPA